MSDYIYEPYPTQQHENAFPDEVDRGLTKREYFAAMAMLGYLACPEVGGTETAIARRSVAQSDALIAALNDQDKP
jgi:hypothetical protein